MTTAPTRHLDLGCGATPRNPYRRDELHGIDVAPRHEPGRFQVHQGNLAIDGMPFADDHFDSVSAYDFFEHVPRVLPTADGRATRFPFVELMNEVWRVLRPGGLLYALTPAYPAPEAFQDPTHVNIITERTHIYFTGEAPLARMYGFGGRFDARRVEWMVYGDALDPLAVLTLRQRWRRTRHRRQGRLSYLVWEFECRKPAR
jgi:SAM-dependent methyltransferase